MASRPGHGGPDHAGIEGVAYDAPLRAIAANTGLAGSYGDEKG